MICNRLRLILSIVLCCLSFTLYLSASAQSVSALQSQLSELHTQLKLELAATQRAKKKLAEAKTNYESTAEEFSQAKILAIKDANSEAERKVRIISVRYYRHKDRVGRFQQRVKDHQADIAKLRKEISRLKSQIRKRNKGKAYQQPATTAPAAAEPVATQRVVATPMPTSLPVRRVMLAKPPDWPYLSNAREMDIAYARKRLHEKPKLKNAGRQAEKIITANSSFGTAVMSAIGDDLYSVVKPVVAGKQIFKTDELEEWHVIPLVDHNKNYRIILDRSNRAKPRLILFRNSLLQ